MLERSASLTWTGWNRRSVQHPSRCTCRYSSRVVAPTVCSSPRASLGLRIDAASIAPSAAPAPTRVCSSSMNRDHVAAVQNLLEHPLQAFLEVTAVPAAGHHEDQVQRVELLVLQRLRPFAVHDGLREALDDGGLADAGSPISTGLFLVRRESTCITRSISFSRPMTGSTAMAAAGEVAAELGRHQRGRRGAGLAAAATRCLPRLLALVTGEQLEFVGARGVTSAPNFTSTRAATPSPHGSGPADVLVRCSCGRVAAPRAGSAPVPSWRAG